MVTVVLRSIGSLPARRLRAARRRDPPAGAEAAQCKGGDASPAKLSGKRAAKAVFCLINKERRSHGMRPLKRQHEQTKAARKHNRRMIRQRCFSHQCPGESDLTGRLTSADYLPCNCSWGIAENIAYGSGRLGSPRKIVEAWMHSSEHRANILNSSYQHIGIARHRRGSPSSGREPERRDLHDRLRLQALADRYGGRHAAPPRRRRRSFSSRDSDDRDLGDRARDGAARMVAPLLPEIEQRTGAGDEALGLALAAYAIPILFISIPVGRLADRLGRRPLLLGGLVLTGLGSMLIAISGALAPLLVGRAVQGLGSTLSWVAALALVSDLARPGRKGEAIGFALAANSLGAIGGPALGGIAGGAISFEAPVHPRSRRRRLHLRRRLLRSPARGARAPTDEPVRPALFLPIPAPPPRCTARPRSRSSARPCSASSTSWSRSTSTAASAPRRPTIGVIFAGRRARRCVRLAARRDGRAIASVVGRSRSSGPS